jgi:O-antigen ligase
VGIPAALILATTTRSQVTRLFYLGFAGFMLFAGMMSLSRSFYVAIAMMWLFGLVRFGRLDLVRYAIPAVFALVLLLVALPNTVRDRIRTLEDSGRSADGSIVARVVVNRIGVETFLENPIVGVGRRNFMNYMMAEKGVRVGVIHNAFLSAAAEQGIVGFVTFCGLVVMGWREYTRAIRTAARARLARPGTDRRRMRLRPVLLQVALLGAIIGSMFHPSLDYKPFWMVLGLAPVVRRLVEREVNGEITQPGVRPVLQEEPSFAPAYGGVAGSGRVTV